MLACSLALLLGALWSRRGAAQGEICGVERPWVVMDVAGLDPGFSQRILGDLRAGLAPSRIDACVGAAAERAPPLATVKIAPRGESSYSIDVSDSVTQKRIGRDLDLGHVPPDGRAFALAVAAEELLRASWAELALDRAKAAPPKPAAAPTPARPPEPKPALPPEPATRADYWALGAALAFEHYGGGQTHFGADLIWLYPVVHACALGISVGVRDALEVDAPDGSISTLAAGGELSLLPHLVESDVVRLDALVALRAARVWFSAEPRDGATADSSASYTLFGRAGLALTIGRAGSVRSVTSAGAGAPFRSFSASDAEDVVTGVSGLEIFARTGITLEF